MSAISARPVEFFAKDSEANSTGVRDKNRFCAKTMHDWAVMYIALNFTHLDQPDRERAL